MSDDVVGPPMTTLTARVPWLDEGHSRPIWSGFGAGLLPHRSMKDGPGGAADSSSPPPPWHPDASAMTAAQPSNARNMRQECLVFFIAAPIRPRLWPGERDRRRRCGDPG